jgi:CBS domain containing-hemolysin-like protein
MQIPDSKEYDTFSGYVLNKIGRIPKEKEEILLGNFLITVNEMDGNRISEYIVRQTELEPPKEASTAS